MSANLYVLCDPRTGETRYVGWTSKSPAERFKRHLSDAKRNGKTYKLDWLRSIIADSLYPVMRVVAILETAEEARRCEVAYIAALRRIGTRLTNLSDGGEGVPGYAMNAATRSKISDTLRGHAVSEEVRKKISAAKRGRHHSAEHCEKIASALRGKQRSAACCAAMSRATMGRSLSAEWRAKLSKAHVGKSLSDEHKAAISRSKVGVPLTEAHRAACSRAAQLREARKKLTSPEVAT